MHLRPQQTVGRCAYFATVMAHGLLMSSWAAHANAGTQARRGNRSTERGRVMLNRHSGLGFITGAIAAVALSVMPALAADLPLKAPPPEPFKLDIHGFFDVQFKNEYITPSGLMDTNTGLNTQVMNGEVLE